MGSEPPIGGFRELDENGEGGRIEPAEDHFHIFRGHGRAARRASIGALPKMDEDAGTPAGDGWDGVVVHDDAEDEDGPSGKDTPAAGAAPEL